jgi:hypothetical protein
VGGLRTLDRYAWAAGIVFVAAIVAESVVSIGVAVDQDDPATRIANALAEHHRRLLVVACLSVVYAPMFLVYLTKLHDLLLRMNPEQPRFLVSLVMTGGVLFVSLHAVSDIGITGALGAKLGSYGAQHDPGVPYALYLITLALDSVGDVFGSLFALAAGLLVLRRGALPRWLGWVSIVVGALLLVQGFGLGGVIATFGVVVDVIGFVLLLVFVLSSSIIRIAREQADPGVAR